MNTPKPHETPNQLASALQAIVESENSLASILSKAIEDIFKIQTSAWASGLNENLSALMPTPLPQNPVHLIWQVPNLMQQKAKRRIGHWHDAFSILSNSQQQMLALASQSLLGNVSQTSAALSKISGLLFSRRQSAEVINFPDRRIQTVSAEASSSEGLSPVPRRIARQAAA